MNLHYFMVAFVVRLSNLLFCDILSNFFTQIDPFILKHYSLIVTIIVYHVPSIQVSVFIQLITTLSQHITFKRITSCLLVVYIRDCNLTTCFIHLFLAVKMGAAICKFYGSSFRSHPRPAIFSCTKQFVLAAWYWKLVCLILMYYFNYDHTGL